MRVRINPTGRRGVQREQMPADFRKIAPTQQQGYLTLAEDAEFRTYAKQHELPAAALGRLLLIRELKLQRLGSLLLNPIPQQGKGRRKVTVHLTNRDLKRAFAERARNIGLTPTAAAAVILRAELSEKWLSTAIGLDSN